MVDNLKKMQELKAQIQAQIKLAETLKKKGLQIQSHKFKGSQTCVIKRREKPIKRAPPRAFSHSSPNCFRELSHHVASFFGIRDFGLVRLSKCTESSLPLKLVRVKKLTANKGLESKIW